MSVRTKKLQRKYYDIRKERINKNKTTKTKFQLKGNQTL